MFHLTSMVDELETGQPIDEIVDSLPPAAPDGAGYLNRTMLDIETGQLLTNLSPVPDEQTAPDCLDI